MPNDPLLDDLEIPLAALGDLLTQAAYPVGLVIVGGAALNLLGFVQRATQDVDVIALRSGPAGSSVQILPARSPLPPPLAEAVRQVGGDLQLPDNWLNVQAASLWDITGLPLGLADRIHWRTYGALSVGLVDRYDLIFLKLLAAADQISADIRLFRPNKHTTDLVTLAPTRAELAAARAWVVACDPSPGIADRTERIIAYVHRHAS